jgi:hypothetical protein
MPTDLFKVNNIVTLLLSYMISSSLKASYIKQERYKSSLLAVSPIVAASASLISCNSNPAVLLIILSNRIPSKILVISTLYSFRSAIDSCLSTRICSICSASLASSLDVGSCVSGGEIGRRY